LLYRQVQLPFLRGYIVKVLIRKTHRLIGVVGGVACLSVAYQTHTWRLIFATRSNHKETWKRLQLQWGCFSFWSSRCI